MKPFEWARHVCADEDVPPMARFVAMTLAMHARGSIAPQSRCSHAQLAEWTGLHRATVIRSLEHLRTAEYLVTVKQHAKSGARAASLYLLVHPESPADPVDNSPSKRVTKVAQSDRGSRTERHHGGRTERHLEDEERVQDVAAVHDLIARMASGMRRP